MKLCSEFSFEIHYLLQVCRNAISRCCLEFVDIQEIKFGRILKFHNHGEHPDKSVNNADGDATDAIFQTRIV